MCQCRSTHRSLEKNIRGDPVGHGRQVLALRSLFELKFCRAYRHDVAVFEDLLRDPLRVNIYAILAARVDDPRAVFIGHDSGMASADVRRIELNVIM